MHTQPTSHQALLIGHASNDLTPLGPRLGGTVSFAGLTLNALGCRVRIVTSAGPELDLAPLRGIELECTPAPKSTTFVNRYTGEGRLQTVVGRANPLELQHVPDTWRQCEILLLGPIASEVEPGMAAGVEHRLLGVTAQGWLRRINGNGQVRLQDWQILQRLLPAASVVILSAEDLQGDLEAGDQISSWCRILALTMGAAGARIYWQDRCEQLPAPAVEEIDPTGAGDIFAATFLYRLMLGDEPALAADWANRVASASVLRPGLEGVPKTADLRSLGVIEH
jgi:sugar/nucleoside kinase (ribokinase family)